MSSHNKTRAEKRAAGLRELSVWLEEPARQAIRDEAERQEVSEVLLVTEWAKSLGKTAPSGLLPRVWTVGDPGVRTHPLYRGVKSPDAIQAGTRTGPGLGRLKEHMMFSEKPTKIGDLPMDGLYVLRSAIDPNRAFEFDRVELLHVISAHAGGEIRGYYREYGSTGPFRLRLPNYTGEWPEVDAAVASLCNVSIAQEPICPT